MRIVCYNVDLIHVILGGLFSGSKLSLKDKANVFSLGDRIETLRMQDQGVILVHIAEDKEQVGTIYILLGLLFIANLQSRDINLSSSFEVSILL